MNTKTAKILYYTFTGLMSALMVMSATMYFTKFDEISIVTESIGFPAFILYPLGIAKILGIIAIWTRKSEMLKEWAYAGFFFTFLLAIAGHAIAEDGGYYGAVMALAFLLISYVSQKKVYATD